MSSNTVMTDECMGHKVLGTLGIASESSAYNLFVVQDVRTRNVFTLKHLPNADDEEAHGRMLHEYETAKRFQHACLRGGGRLLRKRRGIRVSELGLLLPFVDGDRIEAWQPMTARAFFDAFAGLADGLGSLHDLGVVHGAVAPDHVLIDDAGAATLIGFGSSTEAGECGAAQAGAWDRVRAPEICRGELRTARTDLFGLAATIFALVVGRSIVERENSLAIARDIDLGSWHEAIRRDLAVRCPIASLRRLLSSCLEPIPRERPVDAACVAQTLRSLQGVAAVRFDRQDPGTAAVAA